MENSSLVTRFARHVTANTAIALAAGYAVENTLAKDLAKEPEEVTTLDGRRQPLNMLVEYVSFSAHVDFVQNRDFISKVDPGRIVLVHGQKHEMRRLKTGEKRGAIFAALFREMKAPRRTNPPQSLSYSWLLSPLALCSAGRAL